MEEKREHPDKVMQEIEGKEIVNPLDIIINGLRIRHCSAQLIYSPIRSIRDTIFGEVWVAIDKIKRIKVILKRSSKEHAIHKISLASRCRVSEDIFEEIKIHKFISALENVSPHLLKMQDVFTDRGWICMVLDLANGGEVYDYITNRPEMSNRERELETKIYMQQLLHGVKCLHQAGVAHQDLSLENLLFHVRPDGTRIIKVIDYGVAIGGPGTQYAEGRWRTRCLERFGKLKYMSPEVFNKSSYDPRANDLWCCGVIFFIMIFGCPPYEQPHTDDPRFKLIIEGNLTALIQNWGFSDMFSNAAIELIQEMLRPEELRITLEKIERHEFFRE